MIAPPKGDDKIPVPKRKPASRFIWRWVVALAAGAGALAIFCFFRGGNQDAPSEGDVRPKKPIAVVDIKDTIPKTANVKENVQPVVVQEPKTNQWGNPAHWGHKKLRPANYIKVDESKLPVEERIFNTKADKDIAGLLVIEPGADLIGSDEFDERFVKSFLRSLEQPIIISEDDTEEEKSLKRAVIETKIELKERYDAGEDIAEILTGIRREMRELGAYREDLKKELDNLRRDGDISVEEMKDYVAAANIMLEQRGAKKIVMPEFYYRQIEFRNKMKKAKQGE